MEAISRLCVVLIVVCSLFLISEDAAAERMIHLTVDGVLLATLPASSLPSAAPLNLGGRHPYGECSSLYDNVRVTINGTEVFSEDFSDLASWLPWGSPQPEILAGCGNPDPSMRTNGDSNHPSGVCSGAVFDWTTSAWSIELDVKVASGHSSFNAVEFGIGQTECVENVEPCVHVAWGDDHAIGEFWTECLGETQVAIPSPSYDEWHTVVIWSDESIATTPTAWGIIKSMYR